MAEYNPTSNNPKNDSTTAGHDTKNEQHASSRMGAGSVGGNADKASADNLKNRGADMAQGVKDSAQDYVERARDAGGEYAGRAKAEAERLYQTSQQRASEVAHYAEDRYDEVSEMVRRNPAQALGIAAGVGFLIGLILSRR